jgi:nucleoporin NDC1
MPATATTPVKAPLARPYRDFLIPILHQRFTSAFILAIGVCYIESVLLGDWSDPLWSWFPLGFAGLRTLLLCIPLLAVFLLRVQRNHGTCQYDLKVD